MMEYDRVRLKMTAKQAIKFQRPHPMLITLLFVILVNVGSRIISAVLSAASGGNSLSNLYLQALMVYEDPELAMQYALLSYTPQQLILALLVGVIIANVLVALWTSLMQTGYSGFCLGMVRGQQPQTGTLFSAFPLWAGVLLTQFLVGLFVTLWTLLFFVGAIVLIGVITFLLVQISLELIGLMVILYLAVYIALIVGIIWVTLRYAMVNYIIIDQGITGLEAIRESKRLMQGNVGRLFTLRLSFIGWYLLEFAILMVVVIIAIPAVGVGLFAAGDLDDALAMVAGGALAVVGLFIIAVVGIAILNLWLTPYINGTEALFYDWLRGSARPMNGYGAQGGYGGQRGPGGYGGPVGPGGQGGPGGYGGYGGQGGQGGWGAPGGQGGPGGYGGYGGQGGQGGQGGWGGPGGQGSQGGQGGWGQPPQQNGGYTWTPTPGSNSGRGIGSGAQDGQKPPQQPPQPPQPPKDDAWK